MEVAPYCLCAPVSQKALDALLEHSGRGAYRDGHPWHVARQLLDAARADGQSLALLLASGNPERFAWWTEVLDIDVEAFHRGTWETRCAFGPLRPVHEIFRALDSIALHPGETQLRREKLEPVPMHRQYVNARLLRPYAICETPPFIAVQLAHGEQPASPASTLRG